MTKKILFFALFLGCFVPVFPQVQVAPYLNSKIQLFDTSGLPCAGCTLSFFAAGSSTPQAIYTDSSGSTPAANPLTLDSAGMATVYLSSASYKIVLKSALGVTLWTQDNVTWNNLATTLSSLTVTGATSLLPNTAATSLANQNSPNFCIGGFYFNVTSLTDQWCFSDVLGSGTSPTTTLTVSHSGSGGTQALSLNVPVNLGANGLTAGSATINGDATAKTVNGVIYVGSSQYTTLSSAVAVLGSSPGTIAITPGTYTTSSTITLGQGQHLIGTAPCVLGESSTTPCGAIIKWTGANSTAVVNVHNASGASVEGITVDCNATTGCINYLYDSNNTPPSTNAEFKNIGAKGGKFAFVAGLASTTADTNGFQADTFRIEGFQFYCDSAQTTSIGILINSANAGQGSTISRGNLQSCNIGFRGVKSNGGIELRRWNAGSPVGSTPTMLQFDANFGVYLLENMESEGAWTDVIHDSSAPSSANNSVWLFNQFNTSPAGVVVVDGSSTILSMGNTSTNTTFSNSGSAQIISIDEPIWTGSTSVSTLSTAAFTIGPALKVLTTIGATATGSLPSLSSGDIAAVRGTTSGVVKLGSDGISTLSRDTAGNIAFSVGARYPEIAAISGGAGISIVYANSSDHLLHGIFNNDIDKPMARAIASGTSALGTGAISAGTCATVVTTVASGTATTDKIEWSFNAAPGTGYTAGLNILSYVTSGNVNFLVCNPTAGSLTPAAATLNWSVVR